MPEANPRRHPECVVGSNRESGTVNTGQLLVSFGSQKTVSYLSGVATDALIQLGAGRLDSAQVIPSADLAASGLPIVFYDAAVVGTAGPIFASGHKVLGVLAPATTASGLFIDKGEQRTFSAPYTSGLCVYLISGQCGFSASYTPVVSGTNPNNL